MKSLFVSLLLVAGSAMAQNHLSGMATTLSCVVPVEGAASLVNLDVTVSTEESVDFVMLTLTGPNTNEILFTQMEKGSFSEGLASGNVTMMIIQEGFAQEAGVLKKAGIFSVSKNTDGSYQGIMAALGNLYPLACK